MYPPCTTITCKLKKIVKKGIPLQAYNKNILVKDAGGGGVAK
jgi:hypothetical protein